MTRRNLKQASPSSAFFSGIISLIFAFAMPATAIAQKNDEGLVGIFSNRTEYNQFMGGVKAAAYGRGGNPELRAMVPMLNDMALGQEFGTTARLYGDTNNTEFDLLSNAKVREEIGMVDEQFKELQAMNREIQNRAAKQLTQLDFDDRETLVESLKEIQDRANSELESLFIPEQLERLRQLRNRSQLRRQSLVDLLTTNPVRDRLEISQEQADALRETEAELEEEIRKEIEKLRENARKRILDNLSQDQQSQVNKLLGDPFDFQAANRRKAKEKQKPKRGGKK